MLPLICGFVPTCFSQAPLPSWLPPSSAFPHVPFQLKLSSLTLGAKEWLAFLEASTGDALRSRLLSPSAAPPPAAVLLAALPSAAPAPSVATVGLALG
jgi:hypothetical protein